MARELVVFVRRAGGQSQFSAQMAVATAERQPIRDLQGWIADHPEAPLGVPALARRAGMSLRHFARVFRAEVGISPKVYVESVRLETARRLLEDTRLSIERVAEPCRLRHPRGPAPDHVPQAGGQPPRIPIAVRRLPDRRPTRRSAVMNIVILIFDRITALDAIGPYEVLSRLPDAQVRFVGPRRGEVRTTTGRSA